MTSLVFVLGTSSDLAFSELSSVCSSGVLTKLSDSCVLLTDASDESVGTFRDLLGGIVKIAEVVGTVPRVDAPIVAGILLKLHEGDRKITFGISRYDGEITSGLLLTEVKHELEKVGKRVRFIKSEHGALSSVVVQKQEVLELVIAKKGDQWIIAKTLAVQDFEAWNRRDYGRPFADPKSGMLPPKVARIAVNLAMHAIPAFEPGSIEKKKWIPYRRGNDNSLVLLDPFCGMGTILGEGLLRGCQVIGSDISEEVVKKAEKNLEWLIENGFPTGAGMTQKKTTFVVSDATHISEKLGSNAVDVIVTEPYMGPALGGNIQISKYTNDKWENIIKGLAKLYIGCLRDWGNVLKPGGKVVIALPKYVIGQKSYFVKKVVDNCENLGYSKLLGPLEYSRPQAIVKREFYVFQKTANDSMNK